MKGKVDRMAFSFRINVSQVNATEPENRFDWLSWQYIVSDCCRLSWCITTCFKLTKLPINHIRANMQKIKTILIVSEPKEGEKSEKKIKLQISEREYNIFDIQCAFN